MLNRFMDIFNFNLKFSFKRATINDIVLIEKSNKIDQK